jgi:cell wall-associated NlpC family hydrolase
LPRTATAFGFDDEWAPKNNLRVTKSPAANNLLVGDIVVFRFSHVGIYVGTVNSTSVLTIEGNTNGEGSREGDGVYEKIRPINLIRSAIHVA